jgi:hypothetical protein
MATAKFDRLSVSFAARIADPVASASTAGVILTANERTSYINRALHELFKKYWVMVQGDKEAFTKIFPELIKPRVVSITDTHQYAIASPNLDYYTIIDAHAEGVYTRVLPGVLFNTVRTSKLIQYTPTAAKPAIIEMDKVLYVFPTNLITIGLSFTLNIIVQPLNPTDGSFLTQGGDYDSPFMDAWNEEIVNIATEMFLQDTQEK